jgi:hypothetical protein
MPKRQYSLSFKQSPSSAIASLAGVKLAIFTDYKALKNFSDLMKTARLRPPSKYIFADELLIQAVFV